MSERRMIGLDIGSAAVRAAEIAMRDHLPCLVNFGQVALPPEAITAGVVIEPGMITLSIQRLWKERKFAGRDVVIGVANSQVVVRAIDLPWVAPGDLQKSLPYLVGDVLPIPVEDAVLDFLPFDASEHKRGPIRGLLVASPRENVAALVRCAEKAGLRPTGVDLASFALLRAIALGAAPITTEALNADMRRPRQATEALVDIGASITNIVLHQGGVPKVVRIVPRGGAEVTASIAERLGIPLAEAETIKRREGIGAPGSDVERLVRLAVTPLVQQLRGSVEYFTSTYGGARVDRVLLCGGGGLLRGLPEMIEDELGLEVQVIDPMADLVALDKHLDHAAVQQFRPYSAVPIGLALGAN